MPLTISRRIGQALAVDGPARVILSPWSERAIKIMIDAPQSTSIKRIDQPPTEATGRLVLKIRRGDHVDVSGPALIKLDGWNGHQLRLSFVAPEATQIVRSTAVKRKEAA